MTDLPTVTAAPPRAYTAHLSDDLDVTVVVPVTERPDDLAALYAEYSAPLRAAGRTFEFVFAIHPYFVELEGALRTLAASGEPIRTIVVARSVGETALLRLAVAEARGRTVLTLPAYRQVTAEAVDRLLAAVEEGADLAVAHRSPRRDSIVNRAQSAVLHLTLGPLVRDRLHDVACGARAARREVLQEIPLYGDFARFLPLLAIYHGHRVVEVAAPQHASDRGTRVYSPGVYLRRLIDVLGLFFLLRFTDKPLRFFGLVGSLLAGGGAAILLVLLAQRLGGTGIADRPMLLLGVLLLTLGIQTIALGLVGEMIVHFNAPRRRAYRVRRS